MELRSMERLAKQDMHKITTENQFRDLLFINDERNAFLQSQWPCIPQNISLVHCILFNKACKG